LEKKQVVLTGKQKQEHLTGNNLIGETNMKTKHYYKTLMGLEILRRGTYLDRLIAFYECFGSPNPDRRITIWTPEEIAVVIGLPDTQGVPKGKRLSAMRSKITRRIAPDGEIIKAGLLEKVSKDGRYSYRVVGSCGLTDDALEILNRKGSVGVTYCRKSQIPCLMAKERMDDLPQIYLWVAASLKGNDWYKVVPALLDFTEPDTWEFWCDKALNAVSGRDHPLQGVEDKHLRLQIAMTGLEAGIVRNRERNPEWQPGDPYAWVLHALAKLVGRENNWRTRSEEDVRKSRESAVVKGFQTLRYFAEKDVAEMSDSAGGESGKAVAESSNLTEDEHLSEGDYESGSFNGFGQTVDDLVDDLMM